MAYISVDLHQLIINLLNFTSQNNYISISSFIREYVFITRVPLKSLKNGRILCKNIVGRGIINQNKFSQVIELDVPGIQLTNISQMKNLKILKSSRSLIQSDIMNLNLIELDASFNKFIYCVNHMQNLKILRAVGTCGIDQNGIKDVNLIELHAHYNPKIINVNHMKQIRKLGASGNCGINQMGVSDIDLVVLYASDNPTIVNVNHMKSLKKLIVGVRAWIIMVLKI